MRRIHFAVLPLVLAGVLPSASRAETGRARATLVLEDFFRGPLTAEGTFTNTIDGTKRHLNVRMHGAWDGRTLTLVEDFVFDDGEKDRKTWRFDRIAEGVYQGTREDVVGTADVRQDGPDIRLSYVARVKTASGSAYDVRFDDRLQLTGPRTVLNTATLRAFAFVPVGTVELAIRKARR